MLVEDVKRGLITKAVVYKLSRISLSIPDFTTPASLCRQSGQLAIPRKISRFYQLSSPKNRT